MSRRPIRVGISACLLGENVRYDGGHKRDWYITDTLGEYFEWVPVCPEVELGLGTPRPIIRLEDHAGDVRLIMPSTGRDLTDEMNDYARRRVKGLARLKLSGYILKSKSPSCGMERVQVYRGRGGPVKRGRGLFAARLMEAFPDLPVEEEGRLSDARLCDNWIERVFAYHDLTGFWESRWSVGGLARFHARYKFLLLAHSPKTHLALGRIIAAAKSTARGELRAGYTSGFMRGLKHIATRKKHVNVLEHIFGLFKKDLDKGARDQLTRHIREYARGHVPLVVPLVLVGHYVRLLDVEYLRDQVYLNPHPRELALRAHV